MNTKIVISKKLNGAPIRVRVADFEMTIEAPMDDFLATLAKDAAAELAADAAKNAGSPALLLTNSQLTEKLSSSVSSDDVLQTLRKHADRILSEIKKSSVMAE